MYLSLIIPVYNRPGELRELLASLAEQTDRDFEVIVVEDGSQKTSEEVVRAFRSDEPAENAAPSLTIRYHRKPNTGPGLSRNEGAALARGDFFVFLDSDCLLPPGYVAEVKKGIAATGCDVFGGPDRAAADFSVMQKAVSYSMTSFCTTGGIRGGGEKMDKFHPRSFNMGVSRRAFEGVGGFSGMRYGEDIDLSIRLIRAGFKSVLLKDAWVCHKRRTDMAAFFRQVYHSGAARIHLTRKHPHSLKAVHTLPALFTLGSLLLLMFALCCFCAAAAGVFCWHWGGLALLPLLLYALLIFTDSLFHCGPKVAFLSVGTSFVQLWGYGCGFLAAALFPSKKSSLFQSNHV